MISTISDWVMDQPVPTGSVCVAAVGAAPEAAEESQPPDCTSHEEDEDAADDVGADVDEVAVAPELVPAPVDAEAADPCEVPETADAVMPLFASEEPALTGVATDAPPVPVVHCVGPCLSHAGGYGAVWARRLTLVPVPVENVGLLQPVMEGAVPLPPGTLPIWSNVASTRLTGMGE